MFYIGYISQDFFLFFHLYYQIILFHFFLILQYISILLSPSFLFNGIFISLSFLSTIFTKQNPTSFNYAKKERKTYILFKLSTNLTIERIIKVQAILEKVISFLCFFNSKMNTFEISIYVEVGFFCLFWGFFVFSGVTVCKIN